MSNLKIEKILILLAVSLTITQIAFARETNWTCRWTSDQECRDLKPGNYAHGECIVKEIVFNEPECLYKKRLVDEEFREKNFCRWTSDSQCRDMMPGNYHFGNCVVKRIVFDEPECKLEVVN